MNTTVINKVPVSSLFPDRYGVAKTKLYEYLGDLQIRPFREGKIAYITLEQLELLDEYLKRLAKGREAAEAFLAELPESSEPEYQDDEHVHELVHTPFNESPAWLLFIEAVASRLALPPSDPLAPQTQLQQIVDRQWQVTTSQLRQILGIRSIHEGDRLGFRFQKAGRVGRETAWRVEKL
jgi:hypothetical protein